MTPSRLRLIALLALAVPIIIAAIAAGTSAAFGALALASAAAGLAMLLAGPVFRTILSVLLALLGACVVVVAIVTPDLSGPPVVALIGGVLQVLVAVWIATTVRHWPSHGTRYSPSRLAGDPASDWDALTSGDDPTDSAR